MTSRKSPRRQWWILTQCLALMGVVSPGFADTNEPLTKIVVVRVAGLIIPGPWTTNTSGVMSLRLPKPARIEISYAPVDAASNQPLRLLRKLEGSDTEWQEAGGQMQRPEMQLMVMIYDASNHIVSYQRFPLRGRSEGWQMEIEKSEFHQRSESMDLPSGAERLQVMLTAENWAVLGAAAIADFRVLHQDATGQETNIWPDPNLEEGENMDRPEGTPHHWQRSGSGRRMAQVLQLPPPATGRALLIRDEDVRLSATWQADLPLGDRAHAGDTLRLQWREAFSVGIGERSRATFSPPPPGEYVFRVRTTTPLGEPIGGELALNIFILQPPWKRPSFVIPVILISAVTIAIIVWFIVQRRAEVRLRSSEHQRWLERERVRIAQDIHDDLGASLTHMNLLSQSVLGKVAADHPAWKDMGTIRRIAITLTETLDEIVWAVNPRHDTIESLISYLTAFAEEFLGAAGIRARIHVPLQLPAWVLPSGLRHNVFLATKEALHNVVKHAKATEVRLHVEPRPGGFDLTIEDNGRGFAIPVMSTPATGTSSRHRQGLGGVRERIESLGGRVTLDSVLGRGTRIVLSVPLDETPVRSSESLNR